MAVYTNLPIPANVIWPDPIEAIWQSLPTYSQTLPNWKRPDLGLCDRLFIGAVMNSPKEQRTWGSINWLSDVFQVSRPTLYAIGERTQSSLITVLSRSSVEAPATEVSDGKKVIAITPNRVKRTILSLVLPGGVSERSIRDCLQAAFDEGRCAAFVSALIHEAGQRAGEILAKVDHAVMSAVMQARDELFVGRDPILLMIDPHSLVITGLYATEDRDAETRPAPKVSFTEGGYFPARALMGRTAWPSRETRPYLVLLGAGLPTSAQGLLCRRQSFRPPGR